MLRKLFAAVCIGGEKEIQYCRNHKGLGYLEA